MPSDSKPTSSPSQASLEGTPMGEFCQRLTEEFERDPKGARVAELLAEYARGFEDWQRYAHFSEERYTRNLVISTAAYELMVVCWNQGQESPIHNHAGSDCWMAVLEGDLEEVHYAFPADETPCPLEVKRTATMQHGQVAFIRDEIALHLVRPAAEKRAVSLHLYSGPIPDCQLYCPETGKIERRDLCFHSIHGELQAN
ncbi:MAG: cysteine dioxygenase family protein [Planctomycetota bacterium]